jgi:hypothetical protein
MQGGVFLIGFIVFFFALWLAGGGPDRPISFQGPYLTPITTTGDTADAYGGARAPGSPGLLGDLLKDDGTVIATGDTSALRGTVTLSRNTNGARADDPDEEYVTIEVASNARDNVSITGWKIVGQTSGTSAVIPGGAETFRAGSVNQSAAIVLRPGDEAMVTSGRSPVGSSFRENICTGYLDEFQRFDPSLDAQCPYPSEELDAYGPKKDAECASFVSTIASCSTETDIPSKLSGSCEQFIEEDLTYNGCVANHANDRDFALPTWRVFLGARSELFNDERETIQLIDANGKVVDVLSY